MTKDELFIVGGLLLTSAILFFVGWTREDENDETLLIWMGFGVLVAGLVSAATTESY